LAKCVKSVADHSAYSEAYQNAVDWLSEAEQRRNAVSGNKWDNLDNLTQQLSMVKVCLLFCASLCANFP